MQNVILIVALAGVALTLPAFLFLWLREKGIRPVDELLMRYRRLPVFARIVSGVIAVNLFVYGSTKTNGTDNAGGTTNRPPAAMSMPRRTSSPDFTPEQLAAGFVRTRVGTNEVWDFSRPADAHVVEQWRQRGAADDSFILDEPSVTNGFFRLPRPMAVFSAGRLQDAMKDTAMRYLPLSMPLGVAPAAHWPMIAKSNATSQVWYAVTATNSLVVTWQDVLAERDAAAPVSVQAEFFENGNFVYRYDLTRAADAVSNAVIGAFSATGGEISSPASLVADPSSLSSVFFQALDSVDAQTDDRDGDGVRTYDEIFLHGTDPDAPDTDGDGMLDGQEIDLGLDPFAQDTDGDGLSDGSDPYPLDMTPADDLDADGLPDAYENAWYGGTNVCDDADVRDDTGFSPKAKMVLGIDPTRAPTVFGTVADNRLVAIKLWDGFSAIWPVTATNLVFERTVYLGRESVWQQYYLSSRPDAASAWSLQGLALEWETTDGDGGTVMASPVGNSWRVPLPSNATHSVTFRLRAVGTQVRSAQPVYLLAFAPSLSVSGGQRCTLSDGRTAVVFLEGAKSMADIGIDWTSRPDKSAVSSGEWSFDGLQEVTGTSGRSSYEGDSGGGLLRFAEAGVYMLPLSSVRGQSARRLLQAGPAGRDENPVIIVLAPSIHYGADICRGSFGHSLHSGEYSRYYYYPLDSDCLWHSYQRDFSGKYVCECTPGVSCGLSDDNGYVGVESRLDEREIVASIHVGDDVVWNGRALHDGHDGLGCGGTVMGLMLLGGCAEDCLSGCANGDCTNGEGCSLDPVKFRVPLGQPRKGQVSGFAYFVAKTPTPITPELFECKVRTDAAVTDSTDGGSRTISCADERGRDVQIDAVAQGVRLTVREHASGKLEHVWNIVNVNGSPNTIRFTQISRLDNVMQDLTYDCLTDSDGRQTWRQTDNVSGIVEGSTVDDRTSVDGTCFELRIRRNADGEEVERRETWSRLIGAGPSAVLRETLVRIRDGEREIVREASYWEDAQHRARNGKLKLLTASDRPWEYHEWDEDGRELLRVEQRNGSSVPSSFPVATSNGFEDVSCVSDAFLTTYDCRPLTGDDDRNEDVGRVRCETRYVVEGGVAKMIGRVWHRFTAVTADGRPAVKDETWRAGVAESTVDAPGNAYSYRIAYAESSDGVPLVLRNEAVEELDEDGRLKVSTFAEHDGLVTKTTRTSWHGVPAPTYEIVELDATHGNILRTATCLTENDVVIAEELSVYDDQNRLRSTTYLDGTSETNAFSCCRKLWSRDRLGRKTLRSARTGTDHLYYADEEVWLQDVSSNGYKVTQHFLDAFGRETNTVVYAGTVPGEAVDAAASEGAEKAESLSEFSGTGFDYELSVDARGKWSERTTEGDSASETTYELCWSDTATGEAREDVDVRNGEQLTRREWDDKWTERRSWDDYDANGCRVAFEVTESSDYGVVTNAVTWYDFLGREIARQTPEGVTTRVYDGTSDRVTESAFAAEDVVRTTTNLYDVCGGQVGTLLDGIVRRRETTYEEGSNAWWKVTRESVAGSRTNSVTVMREQLTGLSDALRSRTVSVSANGVVSDACTSYDADTGLETRTVTSSVGGTATTVSRHGLVLSTTTDEGTSFREYDAFGRVMRETWTAGTNATVQIVRETEYNAFGDAVAVFTCTNGTDGVLESSVYDVFGRCVEKTDALGAATTMAYDAQGNLVATDGASMPTRSEYDTTGRRTSLSTTRDGILWDVTTWEYDPGTGKCLRKRQADGGETVRTYTPDGLEALVTYPSLQWHENIYDERRRLVGIVSNDGSENAAFGYDEFGQLTSASNAESVIAYERHRGGTATNECVRLGTNAVVLVRTVDEFGRLAGAGREGASAQSIAYATANRPATVVDPTLAVTYAYTPDGYDAGGNSVFSDGAAIRREVYRDSYRPNLVLSVSNYVNNALVSFYDYAHDALGQSVRRNEDVFTYDSRRQLTSSLQPFQSPQTPQTSQTSQTFSYDHIGNFTETVDVNGTNVWTANALNQYASVGATAFSYTPDGGLSSDGRFDYAFDSGNRLTSVSTGGVTLATFAYDALSRRVRKMTSEATHFYFYDGWNLVLERIERADGTVDEIEYFWGKDLSGSFGTGGGVGGLLYLRANGMEYAPLYDANGNVMQYVDRTGAVVASYVYDAFGRTLAATGPLADRFRFRFSTKYHDPETGLVYYGYRFYAPAHARWLTPDPLEEQGGLNLYAFCTNNPVNGYDALGLFVIPIPNYEAFMFWEFVADGYFWGYDNSPISAEMLRMSIWRTYGSEPHVFGEHSRLASAIKDSPEYKQIIADNIGDLPPREYKPFAKSDSVQFRSHDLITSAGLASWELSGSFCKPSKDVAYLDLRVKFHDTYNFEWWWKEKFKVYGWLKTIGNNLAFLSQETGVLANYKWEVSFVDKRVWPW